MDDLKTGTQIKPICWQLGVCCLCKGLHSQIAQIFPKLKPLLTKPFRSSDRQKFFVCVKLHAWIEFAFYQALENCLPLGLQVVCGIECMWICETCDLATLLFKPFLLLITFYKVILLSLPSLSLGDLSDMCFC